MPILGGEGGTHGYDLIRGRGQLCLGEQSGVQELYQFFSGRFNSKLLNTYQGPIRIAIPIRINPQKLTYCKKACLACRFDFDRSGAYNAVLRRISGRI
jgi:hypothetical protein